MSLTTPNRNLLAVVEAGDEKEIQNIGKKMEAASIEVDHLAELLAVPIRSPPMPALDDLPALKTALTTLLGQIQEVEISLPFELVLVAFFFCVAFPSSLTSSLPW